MASKTSVFQKGLNGGLFGRQQIDITQHHPLHPKALFKKSTWLELLAYDLQNGNVVRKVGMKPSWRTL